jgi:hypothetical protein
MFAHTRSDKAAHASGYNRINFADASLAQFAATYQVVDLASGYKIYLLLLKYLTCWDTNLFCDSTRLWRLVVDFAVGVFQRKLGAMVPASVLPLVELLLVSTFAW